MAQVGLSVAVADAHPLLIPRADYVTRINGGRGAVREVCDLLLLAQGKLDEAKGNRYEQNQTLGYHSTVAGCPCDDWY